MVKNCESQASVTVHALHGANFQRSAELENQISVDNQGPHREKKGHIRHEWIGRIVHLDYLPNTFDS